LSSFTSYCPALGWALLCIIIITLLLLLLL
jgi:hypothetical protein